MNWKKKFVIGLVILLILAIFFFPLLIKIGQFAIWIVGSVILLDIFFPEPKIQGQKILWYYIESKFKEHRVALWLLSQLMETAYVVLGYIFIIWILTWMFFSEFYLMLLLIYLVSIIILITMYWRMDVLNNSDLSSIRFKKKLTEKYQSSRYTSDIFQFISGIFILSAPVIVAYIFFIMNLSPEITVKYIIVANFLISSALMLNFSYSNIPILSSSEIDTKFRMYSLADSFQYFYILSFGVYLILWALNIPLSLTILVIGNFKISLLVAVALGIFAFFIFLVVLPYSLGENRTKKEEVMFLEKRLQLIKEIEKTVDLTNLVVSKTALNAINEKISEECKLINNEILNKRQKILCLFNIDPVELEESVNKEAISGNLKKMFEDKDLPLSESAIVKKEKDDEWELTDGERIYIIKKEDEKLNVYCNPSQEISEWLKDIFKPKLSYIDSLRRYREHIIFTLRIGTPVAYKDLDKLTEEWKDSANEKLKEVKKRRPLFWKSISVASIIWASVNTYLGVSLTDILKNLI